jgi:hypothetical protein
MCLQDDVMYFLSSVLLLFFQGEIMQESQKQNLSRVLGAGQVDKRPYLKPVLETLGLISSLTLGGSLEPDSYLLPGYWQLQEP